MQKRGERSRRHILKICEHYEHCNDFNDLDANKAIYFANIRNITLKSIG